MSFKDCILGQIKEGKVTEEKGNKVIAQYDNLVRRAMARGNTSAGAVEAAERVLQRIEAANLERKRNVIQAALMQKEWNTRLESGPGPVNKKIAKEFEMVAARVAVVEKGAMSILNEVADKIAPNFWETRRDHATFKDAVSHMLGGNVADAEARKLGDALKKTFEHLHSYYRSVGGIMGKIPDYFPQVHEKIPIVKAGKEFWTKFVYDRLDLGKMFDPDTGMHLTTGETRAMLNKMYDSIASDGLTDLAALSKKGEMPVGRAGDMDLRRNQSRFLKFKDGDTFLEYNRQFGKGDNGLIDAFLGKVHSMSRDIGIMEKMGPKPDGLARFLDFKMTAAGTSALNQNWVNAQYRILASKSAPGSTTHFLYKMMTATQNWTRAALRGASSISAITHTTTVAAAPKLAGLDATRALGTYLKLMSPAGQAEKEILRRSGYIAEKLNGAVLGDAKYAEEMINAGRVTKWMASMTNKLSGFNNMVTNASHAFSIEGMSTLAEHVHEQKAWGALNDDFKHGLEHFGMNEGDWGNVLKSGIVDNGDAKFFLTNELRVDKQFDSKTSHDLANKIDDWLEHGRSLSANHATLASRAITTGEFLSKDGLSPVGRALFSNLTMFKGFPITVMLSHFIPALERAGMYPGTFSKSFAERKFDHLAIIAIGGTILGGTAAQLKTLSKGQTPKDMDTAAFWGSAIAQGAGMGLFGDFLFGDHSRFGRSFFTELAGPMVGLGDDLIHASLGNLDKEAFHNENDKLDPGTTAANVGRDLFRVAKRNIPLASLWYTRLAVERTVLDNLERMIDPHFDHRIRAMERKLTKETGSQFWWAPGENKPDSRIVGR